MPTFKTEPTQDLNSAIRRLVASGGGRTQGLDEMRVDAMAAGAARNMSLADKARLEAEALRNAETLRADPKARTEYAADAAGMDQPSGTRLFNHLRGVLEQPGSADYEDNPNVQPFPTAAPNLEPGQRERFQGALAATMANRLATGKTNAHQLTQAGGDLQRQGMVDAASRETDVPSANRIISAFTGKLREPFKVGPQGQVLNEEVGTVNEGTNVTRGVVDLSKARAATEGARQGELNARGASRTKLDEALSALAGARTAAVNRGEANKGGARVNPEQVERWASEVARKEWEALPSRERKGMNYQQHLDKVRARFQRSSTTTTDPVAELEDARGALAGGASRAAVASRFKERTGMDLPDEEPEE